MSLNLSYEPKRNSTALPENPNFDCNICLDSCHEPVVTLCGHLYCWPCIYKWLQIQNSSLDPSGDDRPKCPVCKAYVSTSSLVPLYGRAPSSESETKEPPSEMTDIPPRPTSALLVPSDPTRQNNPNTSRNYSLVGPVSTSAFSPTINMVGEIVFAGMFGSSDTNMFAYPYTNSYPFLGNGSPRLRRQEVQLDRSLNRVTIFLFCCIALCLILF